MMIIDASPGINKHCFSGSGCYPGVKPCNQMSYCFSREILVNLDDLASQETWYVLNSRSFKGLAKLSNIFLQHRFGSTCLTI